MIPGFVRLSTPPLRIFVLAGILSHGGRDVQAPLGAQKNVREFGYMWTARVDYTLPTYRTRDWGTTEYRIIRTWTPRVAAESNTSSGDDQEGQSRDRSPGLQQDNEAALEKDSAEEEEAGTDDEEVRSLENGHVDIDMLLQIVVS